MFQGTTGAVAGYDRVAYGVRPGGLQGTTGVLPGYSQGAVPGYACHHGIRIQKGWFQGTPRSPRKWLQGTHPSPKRRERRSEATGVPPGYGRLDRGASRVSSRRCGFVTVRLLALAFTPFRLVVCSLQGLI